MAISPIQIQKYLKGVDYPVDLKTLVESAQNEKAPDDVIELLKNLKQKSFDGPTDVTKAISEVE